MYIFILCIYYIIYIYTYIYIYPHINIYICLFNEMKWIKKKEEKPHNTTQSLPTLPSSRFWFFCFRLSPSLFTCPLRFMSFFYIILIIYCFSFSKFLTLLNSFRKLLRDKNPYFLVLYKCNLSKSDMWFWVRKISLSLFWCLSC